MRAVLCSLLLLVVAPAVVRAQATETTEPGPLAFTHVTVIDATGSPAQPNMTVVVSAKHVIAIGKSGEVKIPPSAQVTDAKGKFMIPGLWDMHSHVFMRKNKMLPLLTLNLFLAHGVTGVRDMGDQGLPDDFGIFPYVQDFEWREAIRAGATLGPRLLLPGVIVDGVGAPRAGWASVATAEAARKEVIFLKSLGADFIKVHDHLSRDEFLAIAEETKKQGMSFAGHVPMAVSGAQSSDAGQKSDEHLFGVLFGCSTKESELMQKAVASGDAMRTYLENVQTVIDTYSEEKAAELFSKFVKNRTFQAPTIVRISQLIEPVPMSDPRVAKYMSPALRAEYSTRFKPVTPEILAAQKLLYQYEARLVGAMNRAGVTILAGTDNVLYGYGLHDELKELVKAGLTPMQALQSATRNAADYLGTLDSMGTIEKGKLADLVLLDANPLDSIDNTRKIFGVVVDGHFLNRQALDRMLAQVEAAANPK